jgi:hypothetical protein
MTEDFAERPEGQQEPDGVELAPSETDDSGRIEDENLAWDMAHASKQKRDWAATENDPRRRESFIDSAETIEKWVDFLHQHPLSEALREKYPGLLDAKKLAGREEDLHRYASTILLNEYRLEQSDRPLLGVNGLRRNERDYDPGTVMMEVRRMSENKEEGQKIADAYYAAISDPETTLGQLRDMYIDAYKKVFIEPYQREAEEVRAFLDEVQSGLTNEERESNPAPAETE